MSVVAEPSSVAMILRHLDMMDRIMREETRCATEEYQRRGTEALVRDLGRAWQAQALPDDYWQMEIQQCYSNTLVLVENERGLRYVEGYALSEHGILPVLHAWAVDRRGRVIDTTWDRPENAAYYGVVIPRASVRAMADASGFTGFLASDWMVGRPLQKLGRIPTPAEIRAAHQECIARRAALDT